MIWPMSRVYLVVTLLGAAHPGVEHVSQCVSKDVNTKYRNGQRHGGEDTNQGALAKSMRTSPASMAPQENDVSG